VLLWVFLAVGREREVADGGEREGVSGCEERGKKERKGKKRVYGFKF
jgi:hypothetical protein